MRRGDWKGKGGGQRWRRDYKEGEYKFKAGWMEMGNGREEKGWEGRGENRSEERRRWDERRRDVRGWEWA